MSRFGTQKFTLAPENSSARKDAEAEDFEYIYRIECKPPSASGAKREKKNDESEFDCRNCFGGMGFRRGNFALHVNAMHSRCVWDSSTTFSFLLDFALGVQYSIM
jgi:hypothetical protein